MGPQAEYIRYGTVWSQLEKNLLQLKNNQSIWVEPQVTVGIYNAIHFTKLIRFFLDNNIETYDFNMVEHSKYDMAYMPKELKQEAKDNLYQFADTLTAQQKEIFLNKSQQIIARLETKTDLSATQRFIKKIKNIDATRNLNFAENFPEISKHYNLN